MLGEATNNDAALELEEGRENGRGGRKGVRGREKKFTSKLKRFESSSTFSSAIVNAARSVRAGYTLFVDGELYDGCGRFNIRRTSVPGRTHANARTHIPAPCYYQTFFTFLECYSNLFRNKSVARLYMSDNARYLSTWNSSNSRRPNARLSGPRNARWPPHARGSSLRFHPGESAFIVFQVAHYPHCLLRY